MSNDVLAYQSLRPDDILAAVESVGFNADGRLLALNSYENRVYRVGLDAAEPLVVKFYRPGRWTDEAILEEHEFSIELADADIPVVAPTASDGRTLHHHGAFRFAIYPCRAGRTPELDDGELLRQIGRLVGRIHRIGQTHEFTHRPALDAESFGERSRDYLLSNGFIPAELEAAYATLSQDLLSGVQESIRRAGTPSVQRVHADLHPSNVLIDERQIHIVDLDDTRTGPTVQDIWMFLSGDRQEQTPQLDELLEGYTEFANFDARELHLIEALRTLRVMHYAAWLARRWQDPAFRQAFPWFNSNRYWDEHILALREQVALMQEEPLGWCGFS